VERRACQRRVVWVGRRRDRDRVRRAQKSFQWSRRRRSAPRAGPTATATRLCTRPPPPCHLHPLAASEIILIDPITRLQIMGATSPSRPCKRARRCRRRRRGFSPGDPCRDADARPNPLRKRQSPPPPPPASSEPSSTRGRRFQFSPLPSRFPAIACASYRGPPIARLLAAATATTTTTARSQQTGCLAARIIFWPFPCAPSGAQNLLAPLARSRPYFLF
jgi:hypothetical protein